MEMKSITDKISVLKNKNKLKNINKYKTHINDYMTKYEREIKYKTRKKETR